MEKYKVKETAWCPGCGNFNIVEALKDALTELNIEPHKLLMIGGIGQAAKTPQYLNSNSFCGLHGRALPPAAAAKIANSELCVIVNSGDGDSYGEGGNHFIHNIRRNIDMTHFVHDNQIYGLTKGQASPTTDKGHVTKVQPIGSQNVPLNPLALSLVMGAGFVARAFSGEKDHLKEIMKKAIEYKGYAIVDILQPCVSFNKINTFKWYSDRVYKLESSYDYTNFDSAMKKAFEWENSVPIGIIYNVEKPEYSSNYSFLKNNSLLNSDNYDINKVKGFMDDFR